MTLALVLAVLGGFTLYNQWPLWFGKTMVFATLPVDPMDPFMGQYAEIRYEFSRIPNQDYLRGDVVYVSLSPNTTGIYRPVNSGRKMPSGDFIKGKVETSYGNESWVKYGIENFYFERNAQFSMQNMTVEAKVSSSGRARLVGLLQNEKPVVIDYGNFSVRE